MKRPLLWGAGLALLAGAIARWARPARLTMASVTAVTPGAPPTASVVLNYTIGAMPARVIVDVAGDGGDGGSATVDGAQQLLEVPLTGIPSRNYRVTVTASYRVLGRLFTTVRDFTAH
jgi:hypothetical protein